MYFSEHKPTNTTAHVAEWTRKINGQDRHIHEVTLQSRSESLKYFDRVFGRKI